MKKERKERENLEKRHDKLFKKANFITQHYDGCLVDLAKEVSLIAYNIITIAYNAIIIIIKLDEVMHTL